MAEYTDLEIALKRHGETTSHAADEKLFIADVELSIGLPDGTTHRPEPGEACFDLGKLVSLTHHSETYGEALTDALFADRRVREPFIEARASTESQERNLRMRIFIHSSAETLHSLRWETLRDLRGKKDDKDEKKHEHKPCRAPLFTGEHIFFSRFLSSEDWRPVHVRPRAELRALVAIAYPPGYSLPEIDVPGELERARSSLGDIQRTEIVSGGKATLENIIDHLRDGKGHDILYLVCHGEQRKGEPFLYLEDERPVPGAELVTRLKELKKKPRLVALASCKSAGTGRIADEKGVLAAVGPGLASAGIPAVLAMQGQVKMPTVEQFMPVVFRELARDGQIDRAVCLARGAIRDRLDSWMPVLFLRIKDGRLWEDAAEAPPVREVKPSHAGFHFGNVGGNVIIKAGSDVVGGDKVTEETPPQRPHDMTEGRRPRKRE
jgi:hypothetical protein